MRLKRWFKGALTAFIIYSIVRLSHWIRYADVDQVLTLCVVLGSFTTPLFWPLFQAKDLATLVVLPALGLDWLESALTYKLGRLMLTPSHDFDEERLYEKPDYSKQKFWSMHPQKQLSLNPDASMMSVGGSTVNGTRKICSAFYLHPSTWYTSTSWNGNALNPVTSYLSDDAIGPQQANVFNLVCRIFAPRFRQMAATGFLQENGIDNVNSARALNVAYEDVRNAFLHFVKNDHRGEPIVVVGHSQGSILSARLLKEFFDKDEMYYKYLVAAYLPGWTFFEEDFMANQVKVCRDAKQIGCVTSWRTFAKGGDVKAFIYVEPKPPQRHPICTNPLSWKTDSEYVSSTFNLGALEVMHYKTMWRYLIGYKTPADRVRIPNLIPNMADAQCSDGHLFIKPPGSFGHGWGMWPFPSWTFASFPGQNLHTYDYNFFFENIRQNAKARVESWYEQNAVDPKMYRLLE